ncbi:hypothetical protein [Enterococcus canintestini]|uniref:hypothetical protein n=1 Tax=Enterococcus canintestini TaxID=317010 RepID=UPI0039965CAF
MEKKEIVPIQIVDRNPPMSPTAPAKSKLAARVKLGQAVFCKTFIHKIAEERYTILQPEIILLLF